jgi:hypothetical protein
MNKKANRKAFFILLGIGLMYMSTAFNVTEKFSMNRTLSSRASPTPAGFSGIIPEKASVTERIVPPAAPAAVEPVFFMAIPMISSAIQEGFIEKEGLILIKRAHNTNADFKNLFEVLKDKDEEGLVSIAEIIGKKQLLHFLKKENIAIKDDLELGDIILGKGYTVEKKKLLALFDRYVTDEYKSLFPLVYNNMEISKNAKGFEIAENREHSKIKNSTTDVEWTMPDLSNLPMKAAVEKLALKTSRVKIYGSGVVTDQNPKAFEKVKGEAQCAIYGRSYK